MSGDVAAENSIHIQNGGSCEVVQSNGVTTNGHGHHHHHHSSSSSSSKHKSSSKDKHRDREREHKSSNSSSSSKEHKSSSRDKDRHKSSSSSSKHRDKDKERDGSSNSHRSGSSSSHKDKDGSSSSKHKSSSGHHKRSSKDKERRDKDKDRGSSSSSRHKSSSSSRDKERSSSSHKSSSSSSSSKSKHSSSRHSSSSSSKDHPSYDGVFVKPEPVSQQLMHSGSVDAFQMQQLGSYEAAAAGTNFNGNGNVAGANYKNGYEESIVDIKKEEESFNNLSQASSCDYSMSQFRADEPPFVVKHEQSYAEEDSTMNYNDHDDDADEMNDDEEDVPLAMRKRKQEATDRPDGGMDNDDDDDIPLLARKKVKKEKIKKESKEKSKKRVKEEPSDDYGNVKPKKKKMKKEPEPAVSPGKRQKAKAKVEEEEVWRWWEEEKRADGVKWSTLEHKGPVFAPRYERVPRNVRFYYDGKPLELSEETEEAATFYAKMLNHDYCTKEVFNNNFFKDFRKSMTPREREIIKDFRKCNFQEMFNYFQAESEKRKAASKEEKLIKKNENEALMKEFGFCMIDGHKEKIGNFRLEPPGLFRGRGEHPKMGMIKRRIQASDVSINCGKDSKVPSPPPGSRWKEVRHDNTVTWLASWIENVQGQVKYIMLNPSSKLKGEKDHIKYETARRLDKVIDKIRATYRDEWKSKEMRVRQRAVALYFIDKLALRAGNEKDEDQADTVGCCSLRVEHVQLHKELNGKENVVVFDFPGKDSIRYYNEVEVEKRVFKNLELFMEHKKEGDDLFDRLNTQVLNEHLKELMEGLTAKVFRTYNASKTLQSQLDLLTDPSATVPEKLLAYNRANRAVAILCNHQRSVPKSHEKSMENLKEKIKAKREAIEKCESEYHSRDEKKGKQLERLRDQLKKLELQETDRDENKTIALGTSKLNYLDPRISVAWCKKHDVPIEKIFNKTQRTKFLWAVHMADENYRF
uniref:DNA topoisomerase 1 n=1 Tax=Drosophila melanogaster TaxID=7227 RepID=TOP1_DROME|nr:RecName: Full=DNA topoisomerase 1; AltName: Full=DNA topoisomerase I [Drosophila melanogaster]AAA28951.1 topoisomerase I [Drosophila melanogaster]AAC24158.1 DNA topoisomerase I [Drosophila melanogaster]